MRETAVIDEYTCGDEREQAIEYAVLNGYKTAVPDLWDGTPFVVDVSSTFTNAYGLLDAIAVESARIRNALGYEVFVAGDILSLTDITKSDLYYFDSGSQFLPPDQHIEIRCCYGEGISASGTAFPWWRIVLLENDAFQSRHIVSHEVWHILGFTHPGNRPGVMMTDTLMYGPGLDNMGSSIPTRSTHFDMARLACIYD